MLTVVIDQSEGISGADIPQQAVKKMRTGSAAPSLPSPCAFFVFPFTERLFTTISEPGTGYILTTKKDQITRGDKESYSCGEHWRAATLFLITSKEIMGRH